MLNWFKDEINPLKYESDFDYEMIYYHLANIINIANKTLSADLTIVEAELEKDHNADCLKFRISDEVSLEVRAPLLIRSHQYKFNGTFEEPMISLHFQLLSAECEEIDCDTAIDIQIQPMHINFYDGVSIYGFCFEHHKEEREKIKQFVEKLEKYTECVNSIKFSENDIKHLNDLESKRETLRDEIEMFKQDKICFYLLSALGKQNIIDEL